MLDGHLDAPACGPHALANSRAQTTLQWWGDTGSCPELVARRAAGQDTARVAQCGRLRASIDQAVAAGVVTAVE